jgi:hypothetical protein
VTARARVWVALVFVVALAPPSDARVVMMPTIPSVCAGGPSWTKVAACLQRFGKVKVLKSSTNIKLVQLSGSGEAGYRIPGIYLYKLHKNWWGLGGMHEGDDDSLIALTTFKAGNATGYRFDLRRTYNHEIMLDALHRHAHLRQTVAVFCSGQSHLCSEVFVACDVYVEGKSYWTFRGTPEITANRLLIHGDRSKAGSACAQEEESWLPAFAN